MNNSQLKKEHVMKKLSIVICLIISLAFYGCAGMSDTQQRTMSGAAIDTAAGGIIGAVAGDTGLGLAVGAVAGAAGGYLYDKNEKSKKKNYEEGYEAGKKSQ
jgi:osmotically inducible lipoprotein OsmB